MEIFDKTALTITPEDTRIINRGTRGVEFRILRKQADFTLQEAANELKKADDPLSTAMLSLFERGLKDLRPATLERLEKIYGVSEEKSKANLAQWADTARPAFLARLPWMNAKPEPRAKSAKGREIQRLRAENNELRSRVASVEYQLRKNSELLDAVLRDNAVLRKFRNEHIARRNAPFYGE